MLHLLEAPEPQQRNGVIRRSQERTMRQVGSSAISKIDYRASKRELFVTFTTGRKYVYFDVPPAVHRGFCNADSLGTYFNAHIRDHYSFQELSQAPCRKP